MIAWPPFPWFGGKGLIARTVWAALGQVNHYIEPFAGGLAVLRARPDWSPGQALAETINDRDGYVVNFWRAMKRHPHLLARRADRPVYEIELDAARQLLRREEGLAAWLRGGLARCDVDLAAAWAYAVSAGIGLKFNSFGKPRRYRNGVCRAVDHVSWFAALAARLRHVRVLCGDWKRSLSRGELGRPEETVGIFLDPPYDVQTGRQKSLYRCEMTTTRDVTEWCRAQGRSRRLRIVVAGYAGEHDLLAKSGWRVVAWSAQGGSANHGGGQELRHKERLWLSPGCLDPHRQEPIA
jgi:site-specific DNA-adenine methylase